MLKIDGHDNAILGPALVWGGNAARLLNLAVEAKA